MVWLAREVCDSPPPPQRHGLCLIAGTCLVPFDGWLVYAKFSDTSQVQLFVQGSRKGVGQELPYTHIPEWVRG